MRREETQAPRRFEGVRYWLPTFAYDRPVTVLMGFVALLVIGLVSWSRIPVQMMPSGFEPGFLWVSVPYPNSSPIETDEKIVRPVEAQLGTVPGIQQLRSFARDDNAGFAIQFHSSVDMDDSYNAVVDRLERALVEMPDDVERYWVYRYDPASQPVVWAGVQLPEEVEDPYHVMTRVVQPQLERVQGVASIDVWGVPQRGVWIDYDREQVYGAGLDLGALQQRLASDNFQMSSGKIEDRGLIRHVRSLSRFEIEDLARFPVKEGVHLADVADIRYGAAYSASINRINGEDAASLAIRKEASANTVEVTERVAEAFKELEQDPRVGGAVFYTFFDQGDMIRDSIDTLSETALTGGLLAIIILYAFLREWRMTLLIAASIPFSMMITVAVLYFRGDTLNLLSLMGLMLAVGMVVDNAIVVVETIYRKRADGLGIRDAAIAGTGEVNLAILASTATTVVVFLPVILMSDNAQFSFFMGVLGMPVIFALGASLVVALVFAPLATRFVKIGQIKPEPGWLRWLEQKYTRVLRYILTHRLDVSIFLLAATFLTVAVAVPGVQCSAGLDDNNHDFTIRLEVPPQASVSQRDDIIAAFEQTLNEHREEWGIRVYRAQLDDGSMWGRLHVYLDADGPLPRDQVMAKVRQGMPQLPGVKASIGWEGRDGDGANQVRLMLQGEDTATLTRLSEEVVRRTRGLDGVMGAHLDEDVSGTDEVRVVIDREALTRYGISAMQVGQLVSYAMRGSALSPLRIDDKEVAVTTRFSLEDRDGLDAMLAYEVWSPTTGSLLPLRSLAEVKVGKTAGQIRREDRRTTVGVTLDLEAGVATDAIYAGVDAALEDMVFPRGYEWTKGTRFSQQQEDDAAMGLALLLSVCFVFLLMGVLFESYVLPLSILTSIPMAGGGAMWALYLTDTPMDTMAGVGLVILVGVVVNNGIVLLDLVTQLRGAGWERDAALLEAGRRRMRPILMTALTTICGLVPMAVGNSSFVGVPYAPLGRIVIGGLISATVLTLLFVPYLYTLLDDLREGSMRGFAWARRGRSAALATAVLWALGLMWSPQAEAQRALTYGEVLQGALDANPQLVRTRQNVLRSQAMVLGAQGVFDPNLSVNGNWRRSSQQGFFQGNPFESESRSWGLDTSLGGTTATGTTYSLTGSVDSNFSRFINDFGGVGIIERIQDVYTSNLGISVSQQVLRGAWSRYNMRTVTLQRQSLTVAELDAERVRQETLRAAAEAYWTWVYQSQLHEIAGDEVEVAAEALRVGRLRVEAGELAPVEETRLEAAEVQAHANLLDAEFALEEASNALLLQIGETPNQVIIPATEVGDVPSFDLDAAEAVQVALEQNLQLAVARAQLDTAELEVQSAKHAMLPSLEASASTGIGNQDESLGGAIRGLTGESAFPFIQFGGNLTVPLGNRAARGERDRAAADVLDRQSELMELQRSISAQVEQQVLTLRSAQRRMELADVNLRLSEQTLAAEEALAEVGRAIQRDVLQARNEVARTRAEAVKARTDYRLAKVRLLELQGQVEVDAP